MAVSVHKWLLNKFRDINHSRMDKHIDIIAKNSGKSKAYIKFDIIRNFLIRGTGYTDYFRCDFINLSAKEKKTFVTAKTFYKILEYLNDEEYIVLDELKANGQLLVEEAIVQSDDLNEINPCVVNSWRVVTLYKDGKAHIINNALRINQDESNVIGCTNDLYLSLDADGRIDSNVIDDYGNVYDKHPMTGKKFSEVKIAGVREALDMVVEAAEKIPQVRYIGWDIAFSKNGPVMVEGNEYPGYGLLQFYKLKGKRTGHLKEIADVLGDEMNNIKL